MSIGKEKVSRETVKKKIHHLKFPKKIAYPEEKIYSSNKMWLEKRKRQKELGCLAEMKTYNIANAQIRKMLNCKYQICG